MKSDFIIESNRKASLARSNITLIPKDKQNNGIIFKLKTSTPSSPLEKTALL